MKPKTLVTAALLLFVAASVAFVVAKEVRRADEPTGKPDAVAGPDRIVAYYFFWPPRCASCTAIEQYAREAIERGFTDALRAGRLEWRTVDVSQPANRHFAEDFDLYTKSVILVEVRGGRTLRWSNLERVWELLTDRTAFIDYVHSETEAFIREGAG